MTTSKDTFEREFERIGEEVVRLELKNGNITGQPAIYASQWLGARAEAREARAEASSRAQIGIARSAKNAAWVAAVAAVVAALTTGALIFLDDEPQAIPPSAIAGPASDEKDRVPPERTPLSPAQASEEASAGEH